jgi:hypothetical protein
MNFAAQRHIGKISLKPSWVSLKMSFSTCAVEMSCCFSCQIDDRDLRLLLFRLLSVYALLCRNMLHQIKNSRKKIVRIYHVTHTLDFEKLSW